MENSSYKEVVVSSDASHIAWNCCVWDPSTGTTISTFKEGNSCSRSLRLVGQDYIVGALKDKPIIKVWTWNKADRVELKLVVPGVVTALAISPRGHHCVAAINKKIYTWEVSSGDLYSVLDFHHQEINCIKFTDDGWHFVSVGKDTIVSVWQLCQVLTQRVGKVSKLVKPLYSWCDHSAEVTDVHVGHGGLKGRVATVSLDQTCKVYSLSTGKLLFSVYTDVNICSVVMDPAEYFLSLGTITGSILQVKWYSCLQKDSLSLSEGRAKDVFSGHSGPVTCLSSSMDGRLLLSGSNDGTVKVWNVLSKFCLNTFKHYAPVTNAFFTMASSSFLNMQKSSPNIVVKPFKRSLTDRSDGPVEIKLQSCVLSTSNLESCDDTFNRIASTGLSEIGTQCKAELQKGLSTMQDTNQQLYSFSMSSFLHSMKDFRMFDQ